jgi:hypothetical protein
MPVSVFPKRKAFLGGLLLVFLANIPLYTKHRTVRWDAFDQWWNHFRWMGSALRQGYFPDFFPHILSGYPLGAEIQAGVYNLFYLFAAWSFPDSVLSINLVYVASQIAVYGLGYAIARTYALDPLSSAYLGLALTASGFVIGHASHFSYLTSAVGLLGCFLSIRLAAQGRGPAAGIAALLSVYHVLTAGYPAVVSFGAQCLVGYWVFTFAAKDAHRKPLLGVVLGVIGGAVLASPAIFHFAWFVAQSERGDGLMVGDVLSGSLPLYSLANLVFPIWEMRYGEPTMERFHLLFVSAPLVLLALWLAIGERHRRSVVIVSLLSAILCTLLALGAHDPLGLRGLLAEKFFLYRAGRFPSGEHRGVALFLLALVSAIGLDWLLRRPIRYRRALVAFIAVDFLIVMYALKPMRASKPNERYRGDVPVYQASLSPREQGILDSPRNCTPDGDYWAGTALTVQRDLAPAAFYWSGYVPLSSARYLSEREANADILCGPSRLWRADRRTPVSYRLRTYQPGRVEFDVTDDALDRDLQLVWSDFDDGLWQLRINGANADLEDFSAGLRSFHARSGDRVEMIYAGPLTRWWRLR